MPARMSALARSKRISKVSMEMKNDEYRDDEDGAEVGWYQHAGVTLMPDETFALT